MAWRDLKDYFTAIGSTWVGLMSGIVGLVLLGLGLFFTINGITEFRYWLIAAILCFVIASFKAWQKHRPDLIIEIQKVVLDTNYGGMLIASTSPIPQFVSFRLYESNTRPADDSIKLYALVVESYGRKLEGKNASTDGLIDADTNEACFDLNAARSTPLKQGIPVDGWLRFELAAEPSIKGQRYKLRITDAYNELREIKGTLPLDFSSGLIRKPGDGVTIDLKSFLRHKR